MRFKVGDRIRIVKIVDKDKLLYHYSEENIDSHIGTVGTIVDYYDDADYPFAVSLDNDALISIDNFKEEELELVEEEIELKLLENNQDAIKYLIFRFDGYYPTGGMNDCFQATNDFNSVVKHIESMNKYGYEFIQVYSIEANDFFTFHESKLDETTRTILRNITSFEEAMEKLNIDDEDEDDDD